MLERGIYLAPSQFEAMMPSLAHTAEQIEQTVAAAREFERMTVLAEIARRAAADSPLWAGALRPGDAPQPRFAGRCPDRYLLGVEMILEGYLLHCGRRGCSAQDDADLALLTGDYLYAAGLVEICGTGDLRAVADAGGADLPLRRPPRRCRPGDDDLWERTVSSLGTS